jgi:hypothetical protein
MLLLLLSKLLPGNKSLTKSKRQGVSPNSMAVSIHASTPLLHPSPLPLRHQWLIGAIHEPALV